MNVNDLRSALRERAGTVTDQDAARRVGQVHARVRVARRRRVAGAVVGVLALVGAVSVLPNRGAERDDTGPATTTTEKFLSHSGQFDLLAAEVGEPGQSTLDLTVPAHRGQLQVTLMCANAGGYWVSAYVGDSRPARPYSDWCAVRPQIPPVPGVSGESPGPWSYSEGLRLQPADEQVTLHLVLTRKVDENGVPVRSPADPGDHVPVSHPDVVLGAAVYTIADPLLTVAGAEIPSVVSPDGQDYAYQEHRLSQPGERTLTWALPPSTEVRYYDVVASDAMAPGVTGPGVDATLDGTSCRFGNALTRFRSGGCLLSAGKPHTITVTIAGDPPADALLGIVLYER